MRLFFCFSTCGCGARVFFKEYNHLEVKPSWQHDVYSVFVKIRLDAALANLTREIKLQNKFGYEIYSSYICIEQKAISNMEKKIKDILSGYKRVGATKVSTSNGSVTINAPEATSEVMGLASTKILNALPDLEIVYWTGQFQTWVFTRNTLRHAGYNVK